MRAVCWRTARLQYPHAADVSVIWFLGALAGAARLDERCRKQHHGSMSLGQPTRASWWPGRAHGDAKRADEKLVEMTANGRKYRTTRSRLAAKRSSPPLGAGRGPVNEGRGSYPWCCCGLGLGEVCGGRDSIRSGNVCASPCCTPQKTAPAFFPSLLLLFSSFCAPDLARKLVGAASWGACPNIFWGNGRHLTISAGLRRGQDFFLPCLTLPNSNSPLRASTAASHLLPKGLARPATPCPSYLA